MITKKFVAYLRVSTARQGRSGLGIEGQRAAVSEFLRSNGAELVEEFVEVESGARSSRAQLHNAFAACRIHKARLLVAKLDRLSRNAAFLLGLKNSGIDFQCCDMPAANRLTVGIMAMVAEEEREMISARTRSALKAAKARGTILGSPNNLSDSARAKGRGASAINRAKAANERSNDLIPIIRGYQARGIISLNALARELNTSGIPTARGGNWHAATVRQVLIRAESW